MPSGNSIQASLDRTKSPDREPGTMDRSGSLDSKARAPICLPLPDFCTTRDIEDPKADGKVRRVSHRTDFVDVRRLQIELCSRTIGWRRTSGKQSKRKRSVSERDFTLTCGST